MECVDAVEGLVRVFAGVLLLLLRLRGGTLGLSTLALALRLSSNSLRAGFRDDRCGNAGGGGSQYGGSGGGRLLFLESLFDCERPMIRSCRIS